LDRVLDAMKRGYTAPWIQIDRRRLRRARTRHQHLLGFHRGAPGETSRISRATLRLVDEVGFDGSFSFVYSLAGGNPCSGSCGRYPTGGEARPAWLASAERKSMRIRAATARKSDRYAPAHSRRGASRGTPGSSRPGGRQTASSTCGSPAARGLSRRGGTVTAAMAQRGAQDGELGVGT